LIERHFRPAAGRSHEIHPADARVRDGRRVDGRFDRSVVDMAARPTDSI
jgi:hypothetical protein